MEIIWAVAAAFSASVRKKSLSWKISVRFSLDAASTVRVGTRDSRLGREISHDGMSTELLYDVEELAGLDGAVDLR
jgi:hypothetical protein